MKTDEVGKAVEGLIGSYAAGTFRATQKAIDDVSVEVMREIQGHVTFRKRTGNYVRNFAIKKDTDNLGYARARWYVKAPYYRLTHLLENGHSTRNGGRTRAFPHITYGEQLAQTRLPELIKKHMEEMK